MTDRADAARPVVPPDARPDLVLRTDRLVLRPLALPVARAIVAGDRGEHWAAGFPQEGDLSVASLLVAGAEAMAHDPHVAEPEPSPWGAWTVTLGGMLVGTAGFHGPPVTGEVELGYGLAEGYRGQGVMGEAVGALLALAASRGVASAVAHVRPGNEPSLRLLRRAGFAPAGQEPSTGELIWRRSLAGRAVRRR